MRRKKIPESIETEVLKSCRRRCCICFALEKDFRVKAGQIAHLDKHRDNNIIDNLAFLCLDCHNNYDSITSQSKGLAIKEVKAYRKELNEYVKKELIDKIPLNPTHLNIDIFSGKYIIENGQDHSELEVQYIGLEMIKVKGISLWGMGNEFGPSIGELDFIATLDKNKAVFKDNFYDKKYILEMEFLGKILKVSENYPEGYFGIHVSFAGTYSKE